MGCCCDSHQQTGQIRSINNEGIMSCGSFKDMYDKMHEGLLKILNLEKGEGMIVSRSAKKTNGILIPEYYNTSEESKNPTFLSNLESEYQTQNIANTTLECKDNGSLFSIIKFFSAKKNENEGEISELVYRTVLDYRYNESQKIDISERFLKLEMYLHYILATLNSVYVLPFSLNRAKNFSDHIHQQVLLESLGENIINYVREHSEDINDRIIIQWFIQIIDALALAEGYNLYPLDLTSPYIYIKGGKQIKIISLSGYTLLNNESESPNYYLLKSKKELFQTFIEISKEFPGALRALELIRDAGEKYSFQQIKFLLIDQKSTKFMLETGEIKVQRRRPQVKSLYFMYQGLHEYFQCNYELAITNLLRTSNIRIKRCKRRIKVNGLNSDIIFGESYRIGYYLAKSYMKLKNYNKAKQIFKEIIQKNSKFDSILIKVYYQLGKIYIKLGVEGRKAENNLKRALDLSKSINGGCHIITVKIREKMNEIEEDVEDLKDIFKLTRLMKGDISNMTFKIGLRIAEIYIKKGEKVNAGPFLDIMKLAVEYKGPPSSSTNSSIGPNYTDPSSVEEGKLLITGSLSQTATDPTSFSSQQTDRAYIYYIKQTLIHHYQEKIKLWGIIH